MNKKAAEALIKADVLKFGAFTLANGTVSPVYVDVRVLPSSPESFKIISKLLAKEAKKLGVDIVAGAETAGIPLAASMSVLSGLPMVYVRKHPKSHGTNSQIEGLLPEGKKVVLVDDMMTDGGSKLVFIEGLRNAKAVVQDVLIVLDREQGGSKTLESAGCRLHALITLKQLLKYMRKSNLIDETKYEEVLEYLKRK